MRGSRRRVRSRRRSTTPIPNTGGIGLIEIQHIPRDFTITGGRRMSAFAVVVRALVAEAHSVDVDAVGPNIKILGPIKKGGLNKRGEGRIARELVVDQLLVREPALVCVGLRVEGPIGVSGVASRG